MVLENLKRNKMTLQEKFKSLNTSFGKDLIYYHHNINKCEEIADEFAIGFSIWCIDYTYHKSFDVWIKYNNIKSEKFTTKSLLEIYKKEKGL
jgi:hypothetical protein